MIQEPPLLESYTLLRRLRDMVYAQFPVTVHGKLLIEIVADSYAFRRQVLIAFRASSGEMLQFECELVALDPHNWSKGAKVPDHIVHQVIACLP